MKTNTIIISVRTKLGLTQKQLGVRLGVTQGAVSHWERGLSYPSIPIAAKFAKIAQKKGITCATETLRGE